MDAVQAWKETISIPTYPIGRPEPNPMFLEKRVYQGSSGVVYPYPVIDKIGDDPVDSSYTAVFLENRYLKIMLLPEIGGRIQMALDKTNAYPFVYYNRVIKPALVGLAGPWISGGIEFNWPQHHRPTTFSPLDWRIVSNPDGSQTVWCAEIEPMFQTKGMHGFTLYPDRAYLEISVQLYNRTSEPQTFLWWANPAVHVNEEYQSVFPPDVHAVMDHGKRDVSTFPIATGTYYKVNYGANPAGGTDISRYKNIPVPTSYMAYHSDYDFVGNYDHGKQAGMIHVANHHIVPGKKQWTWGNSDFGQSWDRQLTDEDGPYIELMCGAYTDNQPDFSWIMPGEEKSFTQVFMPYKLTGPASNASKDVVIHMEVTLPSLQENGKCAFGIYVSAPRRITARLEDNGRILYENSLTLDPQTVLLETIPLSGTSRAQEVKLSVLDDTGAELITYSPLPDEKPSPPSAALPAKPPHEIASNEELFLNGLHLEQYRHATFPPEPYYEEALRRDPGDARCNNALGLLFYRRGKFSAAETFFRLAIERLTLRNPNPYNGEAFYNLGLALRMQGRMSEALDAFYKSAWSAAWQSPAYFELARLIALKARTSGNPRAGYQEALALADQALRCEWTNHRARQVKIALLRHLGCESEARAEIELALSMDPMEYAALFEHNLLDGKGALLHPTSAPGEQSGATGSHYFRQDVVTCTALAVDYAQMGFFEDALSLLAAAPQGDPQVHYFSAWIYHLAGQDQEAAAVLRLRPALPADGSLPPGMTFPNQLESVLALQTALQIHPADAYTAYALGNFWYAHRRYSEAVQAWEDAAAIDPAMATVWRNLGLAYFNKLSDPQRARTAYERSHLLAPNDARIFYELDQLYKKLNLTPQERYDRLAARPDLVNGRDDLTIEYIHLLIILNRHTEALEILSQRKFHPWEGGEGKVTGAYVDSLVESARASLQQDQPSAAIDLLERASAYPPNLGEGKLAGALENHIFFYLGEAYRALGQEDQARQCYTIASTGLSEPTSAMFYNDQPPHMIFYQGLALHRLGNIEEARRIFTRLIDYGQAHHADDLKIDYFAVSLPDFLVFEEDLSLRNQIHCDYMVGLGYLGLDQPEQAAAAFERVLSRSANHLGVHLHRRLL
jgi:tetratricopeptide (TPR) repeat protein